MTLTFDWAHVSLFLKTCFSPGAFKFTIGFCVKIKKFKISLLWKSTFSWLLENPLEFNLKRQKCTIYYNLWGNNECEKQIKMNQKIAKICGAKQTHRVNDFFAFQGQKMGDHIILCGFYSLPSALVILHPRQLPCKQTFNQNQNDENLQCFFYPRLQMNIEWLRKSWENSSKILARTWRLSADVHRH